MFQLKKIERLVLEDFVVKQMELEQGLFLFEHLMERQLMFIMKNLVMLE